LLFVFVQQYSHVSPLLSLTLFLISLGIYLEDQLFPHLILLAIIKPQFIVVHIQTEVVQHVPKVESAGRAQTQNRGQNSVVIHKHLAVTPADAIHLSAEIAIRDIQIVDTAAHFEYFS
jgi:hypothetical protein